MLGASHLLLANPAIDASELGVEVGIHRLDGLVFPLELLPNHAVHLVVPLAHLFNALSALFALHAFFDIHLVAHVFDLAGSLFLLSKETIDEICDLDFELVRVVVLHRLHQVAELVTVLQSIDFKATDVLLFFLLFHVHQLNALLKAHQFSFDSFKDLIKEHRGSITFAIDHLVVVFRDLEALLQDSDTLLKLRVQSL